MKLKLKRSELIFLTILSIYVCYRIISMSTFYPPYEMTKLIRYGSFVGVLLKCIYYDRFNKSVFISICLLFILSFFIRLSSSYMTPLVDAIFIIGAYNVDFEKIVKTFFIFGSLTLGFVIVSSQIGIIQDIVFINWGIPEHCFGYTYSTDFVHQIVFLVAAHIYMQRNKKYSKYLFVLYIIIAGVTYYYCRSRLGSISLLILAFMYIFIHKKNLWKIKSLEKIFMKYSIIIFACFSIISGYLYNGENLFWRILDEILTFRLTIVHKAFQQNNLSLFGQEINMHGTGINTAYATEVVSEYFYLDSAYVYALFCFGIIIFLLFIIYSTILLKREFKRANYAFCTIMVLIALHGAISAQMLDVANNIFLLAFFSNIDGINSKIRRKQD